MSFKGDLLIHINEYTNLQVHYLHPDTGIAGYRAYKVPYYMSKIIGNYIGGKCTPGEIGSYIRAQNINWVNNTPSSYELKPSATIQTQMKTETHIIGTGVDCSGFAYYVLNEASKSTTYPNGALKPVFNNVSYANGISAASLCDTAKGTLITKAQDVKVGCTIYLTGHVMVVYDVVKDINGNVTQIKYAHSQRHFLNSDVVTDLANSGPNKGYITVGNKDNNLNDDAQIWNDINDLGKYLKKIYIHTTLLNCISSLV